MIKSIYKDYFIKVNGKEEYKRLAKLLDKAGKRWKSDKWSGDEKYTDWNPYDDPNIFLGVGDNETLYILPSQGGWTSGLGPDASVISVDEFEELSKK